MRRHFGKLAFVVLTLPTIAAAQAPSLASAAVARSASGASVRSETEELRAELERLQEQLRQQSLLLERYRAQLDELRRQSNEPAGAEHRSAADAAASAAAAPSLPAAQGQAPAPAAESPAPLFWRLGTARVTPGGFLDFTAIFRSTNVGSGIGTSFGSIPFNTSAAGRLTETRFTAQNSRLSLKVETPAGRQELTGYVEADFLGVDPPNAFVTSNSHSFRMRLYWVSVHRGKWEVLGGQSWSLLTPNRRGLSAVPADIFFSQDMDTNYQVGLTWARQAQLRVLYHPSSHWTLGASLENPQQYITPGVVLPSPALGSQFDAGSNAAAPNLHPDLIVKMAYDATPAGRNLHVEAGGLLRSFKTFDPAASSTHTLTGGGVSAALLFEAVRNLRLIATGFWSDGGGRYIFGLGPDVVVRPDGTLSAVHAGSGIAGLEWQVTPAWLFYSYYGGAYFQRNYASTGNGFVGFGFPGSSSAANRTVQEATLGFVRTLWRDPAAGALQLITQGSYLTRSPWSVATGRPKNAHLVMGYVDLRYVLP
jgi:hypothetical protein